MHGYQIIQELTERTGGAWRPSPGSVYPTLQQLEDEELVRETASESGKRVYELTDAGREQASATTAPWTAAAGENDEALVALRDLVHQVLAATRQVAQAGSAAQLEAAQAVLRDARRSLYRLLAEDDVAAGRRVRSGGARFPAPRAQPVACFGRNMPSGSSAARSASRRRWTPGA